MTVQDTRSPLRTRLGVAFLGCLFVCFAAMGGCYAPDFGPGGFACLGTSDCPDGYRCVDHEICQPEGGKLSVYSVSLTVAKVTPTNGQSVVSIKVSKSDNFTFSSLQGSKTVKEGEGHYHMFIDTGADENYLGMDFRESTDVILPADTAKGEHKMIVILVEKNHQPLDPMVRASAQFQVK